MNVSNKIFTYTHLKNSTLQFLLTKPNYSHNFKLILTLQRRLYLLLMVRNYALVLLGLIGIHLVGCKGKDEMQPAYIHIDAVDFQYQNTDIYGNGGTNITDVWVYNNSSLLGVFQLPATIAVAAHGNHEVSVAPGIKLNGISATREHYRYYSFHHEDVTLAPLDTVTVAPKTRYIEGTGISFNEDFQNIVLQFDTISASDVALQRTYVENGPAYLSNYVGKAITTADKPGFKAISKELFLVPATQAAPIYLEMDYKCNQDFIVSTILKTPADGLRETELLGLRSTIENGEPQWRHIYIDLTDAFVGQTEATGFGIGITAYHNTAEEEGILVFDNIKVVNEK